MYLLKLIAVFTTLFNTIEDEQEEDEDEEEEEEEEEDEDEEFDDEGSDADEGSEVSVGELQQYMQRGAGADSSSSGSSSSSNNNENNPLLPPMSSPAAPQVLSWVCLACTLENDKRARFCAACGGSRAHANAISRGTAAPRAGGVSTTAEEGMGSSDRRSSSRKRKFG